ncbi:MAG: hypothetical protein K2X27_16250, partial [Candidatus Obscuribacterales bacterium]|nr:hypothetical protein [Candidatus Obscuribacterales bacterium]
MIGSQLRNWFGSVWHDARLKIDLEEHHGHGDKLVRELGLWSIFLFTVTQAVGAGILTTPGIIARSYAGAHAWQAFLYAGLICAAPALCLAYLSTLSSKSGSTGSYAATTFGQLWGMLMFVDVAMECIGGTAAVAVSQAEHVKMALDLTLGIKLSDAWTETPTDIHWLLLAGGLLGCIVGGMLTLKGKRALQGKVASGTRLQKRPVQIATLA